MGTFLYYSIFAIIICIIVSLFSFKRGKFLENFQLSFIGETFTFWVIWFLYACMLAVPKRLAIFSNIIITGFFIALLFILIWSLCLKSLTRKKAIILISLTLICSTLYKQDQKSLQKINISTNEVSIDAIDIDYKTDISIIDVSHPSFSSNDSSSLKNIIKDVDYTMYDCKEQKILWSSENVVIISKDKIWGYVKTPLNIFEFTPRNTMPSALLFQNPINIGMAIDEDIPYFKYALLKKNGLLGDYRVSKYALCNALTYEIEYYEELPDFAQ